MPVDAMTRRILTREKGTAAGRADRAVHIEVRELCSSGGERIKIRCLDDLMSVAAEITPAQVIGQDEDDVWPGSIGGRQ